MSIYTSRSDATYGEQVEDTDDRTPWAALLLAEAARRGWTTNALSRAVPVNRATFYRWLNGRSTPDVASVRLVAEVLELDVATAMRAAGRVDTEAGADADDWELRMIRESGLHPQVIKRLIVDALARRQREQASRREELERQIALLKAHDGV
jgi:transcriptional regulator with XRE-family HTH domain